MTASNDSKQIKHKQIGNCGLIYAVCTSLVVLNGYGNAIIVRTALSTHEPTSPDDMALSSCPGLNKRGPSAWPSMIADMPFLA